MSFADIGKTKGTTGSFLAKQPTTEAQDTAMMLENLGYGKKESLMSQLGQGALSLFTGITNVMRTGEYAVGGLIKEGNPIKGIQERISPSEALMQDDEDNRDFWSKENLAGFVIDTLLDPVTYLSFGTSGIAKLSTKGGSVAITKAGQELMEDMVSKGMSQGVAKKALAKVIQEGGEEAAEKYIGKEGLKFMGKVFVPAKQFETAGKIIGKTPIIGETLNKVGRGVAKAFVPFSEIDQLPASLGGKGRYSDDVVRAATREAGADIGKITEATVKRTKELVAKEGADIGKEITKKIESKATKLTPGNLIDDTVQMIKDNYATMFSKESKIKKELGQTMGNIDNYTRHSVTKEGLDFLNKKGNSLTSYLPKPLRAKLDAAIPRTMEGTIQEINEYMLKTHGVKKFFEEDAFKLFGQRSVEHIKYMNAYKMIQDSKQFGVPANGMNEVYQEGIKMVKSTNPLLKDMLFAEPVVKHLDATTKILTNEESMGAFIKTYDNLLHFWKKSVTGFFPAFHTRNALGGTFNNFVGWEGNPATMIQEYGFTEKMLKGVEADFVTKTGKKYTSSQLLDLAKRFGVKGQTGQIDVLKSVTEAIDEITSTGLNKLKLKGSAAPLEAMGFVEDRLRLPLFLNSIREGFDPAEAAKKVFKYHFDYNPVTGLTDFERLCMKRLMPFYTWSRNNIPLQIEQIMKQPGKYAGMERIRRTMLRGKEEEMQSLPSWMNDQFTFPVPFSKELGKSVWVSLDLPFNDINKLPVTESGIRAIATQLTPFLKFPLEKFFNKNMYFGGDIVNPDLPAELQTKETTGVLTMLPEPLRKFLGVKKVSMRDWSVQDKKVFKETYEINANNLHILQSFLGRYLSTMDGLSKEDVPAAWKASKYLGGVPIREVDIGRQQAISDSNEQRQYSEIVNYLKQHNVIPYASSKKKALGFSK